MTPASTGANRVAQVLQCRVDVSAANLSCASADPSASVTPAAQLGRGARFTVMVGNQNRYVRLASSNVAVSSGVFSADVTVQNLLLQPLGTLDGFTPDAAGLRVFFQTGPTNGVTVANADGTGTFTGANQPYFQYSELLQPSQVSTVKPWQFTLNGATSFTFEVYVTAEVPNEARIATPLTAISGGYQHACGLDADGHAYCWGLNAEGQLGDGTTTNRTTPTPVTGGLTFTSITAGYFHTCALTAAGQAYCWGDNRHGQLGDGTTTNQSAPTAVTGGLTFTTLSAAGHTCGLIATGEAYCWGGNQSGRLGDGTVTNRSVPTAVLGGLTFTVISTGGGNVTPFLNGHTCALTAAGVAYCWGSSLFGEIGNGMTTNRATPTPVAGGLTFAAITAGARHSCALTAAGVAYCWGSDSDGQLGDGTRTGVVAAPTAVIGGLTFATVQSGPVSLHTCGLTAAGAAYCWGRNTNGQVGDGTTTSQSTPTSVASGIAFAAITGGGLSTCGSTPGGMVYCWGNNAQGQLGDGTLTQRTAPVFLASTKPVMTP